MGISYPSHKSVLESYKPASGQKCTLTAYIGCKCISSTLLEDIPFLMTSYSWDLPGQNVNVTENWLVVVVVCLWPIESVLLLIEFLSEKRTKVNEPCGWSFGWEMHLKEEKISYFQTFATCFCYILCILSSVQRWIVFIFKNMLLFTGCWLCGKMEEEQVKKYK